MISLELKDHVKKNKKDEEEWAWEIIQASNSHLATVS